MTYFTALSQIFLGWTDKKYRKLHSFSLPRFELGTSLIQLSGITPELIYSIIIATIDDYNRFKPSARDILGAARVC